MKNYYIVFSVLIIFSFKKSNNLTEYVFPKLFNFTEPILVNDYKITDEGVTLGRYLFYDKILSRNKSFSCASCHKQEFAFADNSTFSTGINGDTLKRNTPPIFNVAWYNSLFWDGRAKTIEEQILFPVSDHKEMDLDWKIASKRINQSSFYKKQFRNIYGNLIIDSLLICNAIAQFERSLISCNSKYDDVIQGKQYFSKQEHNGFVIVNDQSMGDCFHCHTTDVNTVGTTGGFANNGLDTISTFSEIKDIGKASISNKKEDIGVFKIPSLRNIAVTAPYMHDGRFQTLEEVLDFYSEGIQNTKNIDSKMQYAHKGGVHLSENDKKDVVLFLKTLTDSSFINNSKFSNPFY